MDTITGQELTHFPSVSGLDLSGYTLGFPQKSGALTVVPVFGPERGKSYNLTMEGLKLSQVRGYGNLELANLADTGVAIVPLHMGYIQDGAQNHALCRSAFIGAGQKVMFDDACCVQASQGGFLTEREQWFFILPLQLRYQALKLRRVKGYSKLWQNISQLNHSFDLPDRGHLEQIISRSRAYLTQYQSRFELLPGQTGALFFVDGKLAGIELLPSARYFQELWMPLVCFCYGVAAMQKERKLPADRNRLEEIQPFAANNLSELKVELQKSREDTQAQIINWLSEVPAGDFQVEEEERYLDLRLKTVENPYLAGQYVEDSKEGVIYASFFAKPESL